MRSPILDHGSPSSTNLVYCEQRRSRVRRDSLFQSRVIELSPFSGFAERVIELSNVVVY
jgi:hypothetical protein